MAKVVPVLLAAVLALGAGRAAPPSPLALARGIHVKGDTVRVERVVFDHYVGEGLPGVLQTALATPHVERGRLSGFRLTRLHEGSVWKRAGFRDGDLVTAINDKPFTDVWSTIAELNALRGAERVAISLKRGKKPVRKTIVVQ